MKAFMKRIGLAVAVLGLVVGAAGQARAGLIITSQTTFSQTYSYDYSTGNYNLLNYTPGLGASASYDDGVTQLDGTTGGTASGLAFDLTSAASVTKTAAASTEDAYVQAVHYVNFTAQETGLYDVTATAMLAATAAGFGSAQGQAYLYLNDETMGIYLYQYENQYSNGQQQAYDILPAQVTLHAGRNYQWYSSANSYVYAEGFSSAFGSAAFSGNLTAVPAVAAVPEPSTLAGGLLGVALMGGAWLRRRKRQAA